MTIYSEVRIRDYDGEGDRILCHRPTAAECWRLIDKYEGTKHWPPRGTCYVVKVTRSLSRRPWKRPV